MTVIFYAGHIQDYAYMQVVARFEISGYGNCCSEQLLFWACRGKLLTGEEKGKLIAFSHYRVREKLP